MMSSPMDGEVFYFPFESDGRIQSDAQYWFLFESWDFAGLDAWLVYTDFGARFHFGAE